MNTIKELGKALYSINLLIVGDDALNVFEKPMIDYIIEGCPKLKTLTLESLRGFCDLPVCKESLEALYKSCKELKDLKLTKAFFEDIFTEDEIKKILPDCNVEIKECKFEDLDDSSRMSDDSYDSWDVSFDDGEEYYESDKNNDILDNFDGREIELLFSQNYEDISRDENGDQK